MRSAIVRSGEQIEVEMVGPLVRPRGVDRAPRGRWPTPRSADYKGASSRCPAVFRRVEKGNENLPEAVQWARGDGGEGVLPLSPAWVEWLMGFPMGWTETNPAAGPGQPDSDA